MSQLTDFLTQQAQTYAKTAGLKVTVKSNLGGPVVVYDADHPDQKHSALLGLVKVGVKVTDRQGKELASYGGWPGTNYALIGGLVFLVGSTAFILGRGL